MDGMLARLVKLSSRAGLPSRNPAPAPAPQVAAVHLHPDPFAVENGLMTPTFKLKRPQAQAAFQHAIDGACRRGALAPPAEHS